MSDTSLNSIEENYESVINLKYLDEMMGGKKSMILGIIDAFLIQIPEELKSIEEAAENTNFVNIRKFAHTMKSTVSIMGISSLTIVLQELEDLATQEKDINRIRILTAELNSVCVSAIKEVNLIRINYLD